VGERLDQAARVAADAAALVNRGRDVNGDPVTSYQLSAFSDQLSVRGHGNRRQTALASATYLPATVETATASSGRIKLIADG